MTVAQSRVSHHIYAILSGLSSRFLSPSIATTHLPVLAVDNYLLLPPILPRSDDRSVLARTDASSSHYNRVNLLRFNTAAMPDVRYQWLSVAPLLTTFKGQENCQDHHRTKDHVRLLLEHISATTVCWLQLRLAQQRGKTLRNVKHIHILTVLQTDPMPTVVSQVSLSDTGR